MKAGAGLRIRRMLELGGVSRSSFYRYDPEGPAGAERDMDLRDAIQRIALQWPSYGRPRLTAELRRRGWRVNPKRVYRLMREDNLLCLRRRKFVITTDSNHGLAVYPNRARELVLTGLDQLWVADITYIRLEWEFVYLAVILDAFSRRVIGWALDRTLEASLTLDALRMALAQRSPAPGLVHHSDRGVQYASTDYTDLLKANGVVISMSRSGNPYDNATCESFIKTLKYEEVYRTEYRDLAEARASIGEFLEQVYDQQLCLSKTSNCVRGWELSFFRNSLIRCSIFLRHCCPLCLRSCVRALPLSWRTWPCGTKSACCSGPQENA
jgi:putative transposase